MPYTGELPSMTFTGQESGDLAGSNGAGNEQAGLRADLIALFNLLSTLPAAGKIPIYDDDGNLPILSGIDVGAIQFFPSSTAPTNYIKANGALLSRTQYPLLWAFAQNSGNIVSDADWSSLAMYGSFSYGDGATTFRIPKLNGYVLRGFDDGAGIDAGRVLGSYQADDNKEHLHYIINTDSSSSPIETSGTTKTLVHSSTSGDALRAYLCGTSTAATIGKSSLQGGAEVRVKTVALLACIRYQ